MSATAVVLSAGAHPALPGLVALLRPVADSVVAVVVGDEDAAAAAATAGAGRVLWLPLPEATPPEALATAAAGLAAALGPTIVAAPTTGPERVLLGAAAARLGTAQAPVPLLTGVTALTRRGDALRISQTVHSGIAERDVETDGPVALCLAPQDAPAAPRAAAPVERHPAGPGSLRVVAETPGVPTTDLRAARRVVVAGRGAASPEGLALVSQLAEALGAELAVTRPLTQAPHTAPHERCVGLSGVTVAPDLYVGVGVSGQLQHAVGMRRAGTVVAINADPAAPQLANCDHGLVGDLYAVVPALLRALARPE